MKTHEDLSHYLRPSILDAPPEDLDFSRWQTMVNRLARLFSAPVALINQANEYGIQVINGSENNGNPYQQGHSFPHDSPTYCQQVVSSNETLYVRDARHEAIWHSNPMLENDGMHSYLGMPLQWPDGSIFGTLCIMTQQTSDYGEMLLELMQSFKEVIDYELQLIETNRQLRALSLIDPMTDLYNRRGLTEAGRHLIARAIRQKSKLAVLYLDIDDLKPVNDNYSHETGNELIKSLAGILRIVSRAQDIIARLGGDEFVLLALVDDEEDVVAIRKRLEEACSQKRIRADNKTGLQLQVSIGSSLTDVRTLRQLEELIDQADADMFEHRSQKISVRRASATRPN